MTMARDYPCRLRVPFHLLCALQVRRGLWNVPLRRALVRADGLLLDLIVPTIPAPAALPVPGRFVCPSGLEFPGLLGMVRARGLAEYLGTFLLRRRESE